MFALLDQLLLIKQDSNTARLPVTTEVSGSQTKKLKLYTNYKTEGRKGTVRSRHTHTCPVLSNKLINIALFVKLLV